MRAIVGLFLIVLSMLHDESARATAYPYPYPYTVSSQTGAWRYAADGSASATLAVPAADIRNGELLGYGARASSSWSVTYQVRSSSTTRGGDRVGHIDENYSMSAFDDTAGAYYFVDWRCLFSPCSAGASGVNEPLTGNAGATVSNFNVPRFSQFKGTSSDWQQAYVNAITPLLGGTTATYAVQATKVNDTGTVDSYLNNSTYQLSGGYAFRPWTTLDAVAGRGPGPGVQLGHIDLTLGTNFGFTPAETAHLSGFDNLNWLVSFTGYCEDVFKLSNPYCVFGNDNALAPTSIGRVIGDFDGRAGGNLNSNANNALGADAFDLYFDQTPSPAGSARAAQHWAVTDPYNAGGLRFWDQPRLCKKGRMLSFHNALVGWDQTLDNGSGGWVDLSVLDPDLSFNWNWLESATSTRADCSDGGGVSAITAGTLDDSRSTGVAWILNTGAPDESLIYRPPPIDLASLPPGTFFETVATPPDPGPTDPGTPGPGTSVPGPATLWLMLAGALAAVGRSRVTITAAGSRST